MKKQILGLFLIILVLTGCEKVAEQGKYKEGTYFAFDEESKYTVAMYVNDKGSIKSVLFDAPYIAGCEKDLPNANPCDILSTKRSLGEGYGMANFATEGEWYKQVDNFAEKVIEKQGIDWLVLKYKDDNNNITEKKPESKEEIDKKYTDTVAGVTIRVDNLEKLINNVLNQAKK